MKVYKFKVKCVRYPVDGDVESRKDIEYLIAADSMNQALAHIREKLEFDNWEIFHMSVSTSEVEDIRNIDVLPVF